MANELLGKHKPSSEWYTPIWIWDKVFNTFGYESEQETDTLYDPCEADHKLEPYFDLEDGLCKDWTKHYHIYVNPPIPAAPWAKKAIETVRQNPDTTIIFAAFSEAVLWQVPELLDYPVCWVRNRIHWIDGNKYIKLKNSDGAAFLKDGNWYTDNLNYLKPSKSPRNYNAFVLLRNEFMSPEGRKIERRFCQQFIGMGTIQLRREVYKP